VTLLQTLLWPLSVLYGAAVRLRTRAYQSGLLRRRRLDGIAISVGNLTVGGTGKTPMVLWIAERLLTENKKVGILTRGYRGQQSGTDITGDEAQLLQSRLGDRVAFGVGPDRYVRGRELANRGVERFVLDDAFQHLQLARNVDIVLIDATNPFGGGHVLPAGRLREPKSALARADIVVITRSGHAPAVEAMIRHESQAPIFHAEMRIDSIRVLGGKYPGIADLNASTRRLFVFCGIGNPSAFLADLRAAGFSVVGQRFFRDHHRYSQADVDSIEAAARQAGADALLCTEKDVFNLPNVRLKSLPISYCQSSLCVQGGDEFWHAVMNKAESR
jgi:tetraacyldisaccharide 4'-kinase